MKVLGESLAAQSLCIAVCLASHMIPSQIRTRILVIYSVSYATIYGISLDCQQCKQKTFSAKRLLCNMALCAILGVCMGIVWSKVVQFDLSLGRQIRARLMAF